MVHQKIRKAFQPTGSGSRDTSLNRMPTEQDLSPRFSAQFRDTTLQGATRKTQNKEQKKIRLEKKKQQRRKEENQRIQVLRQAHTEFEAEKSAVLAEISHLESNTAQEHGAATKLQAQWRGKSKRTNHSEIVQTIKNEEQVRERQLRANQADINRHRSAAASAASFRRRGPTTTMTMTTGRDGASPVRPRRPSGGASKRRQLGTAYGNNGSGRVNFLHGSGNGSGDRFARPGRSRRQHKRTGVPTPKRVKLSTEQRKRATRASRRGAATQWALQKKKAAQHALFVKIRREMLNAGHDEEVVTNNALIAAKKIIVKRERAQLEKEAEELRLFEIAEKKRVDMVKRTKAAAAKKWEERQHRMTPVLVSNLWRPTAGYSDDEDGGASFLLGPVPKKQLPARKSDKIIRRSPVHSSHHFSHHHSHHHHQQQRPSTGFGRHSRATSGSGRHSNAQPVRPSTTGGSGYNSTNNHKRRGGGQRNAKSIVAVQNSVENVETFPLRPETSSATSIFDTETRSVGSSGGGEVEEVEEVGAAGEVGVVGEVGGSNNSSLDDKNGSGSQVVVVEKEQNSGDEDDEYDDEDEFEDDDFEEEDGDSDAVQEQEKKERESKQLLQLEKEKKQQLREQLREQQEEEENERKRVQAQLRIQTEQEEDRKKKKKASTTYHQPKPVAKDPPLPIDPNALSEWKCKCGFENDLTDQACILCGVQQSDCTSLPSPTETFKENDENTSNNNSTATTTSPSKEAEKEKLRRELLIEMKKEDDSTGASPTKTHSYPSLDAGTDDDESDEFGFGDGDDSFEF